MTQEELGRRLKEARERLGLSQDEVAKKLDIPRASISMLESGQRKVDSLELLALSRIYKKPISSFLGESKKPAEEPSSVFFRLGGLVENPDHAALEKFSTFCNNYGWLTQLLGLEPMKEVDPFPVRRESRDCAKELAGLIRAQLGLGYSPIHDVFAILRHSGIHCLREPVSGEISGIFVHQPSMGAFVLVNSERSYGHQAFTASHELCHFLKDRPSDSEISCHVSGKLGLKEIFANYFAADFLMPQEGIAEWRKDNLAPLARFEPRTIVQIQGWFRVSYSAILVRLKQLEYITEKEFDEYRLVSSTALARQLGYPEEEGLKGGTTYPEDYWQMAFDAYRENKISIGRLAELLEMQVSDVQAILKATTRKSKIAEEQKEAITLNRN